MDTYSYTYNADSTQEIVGSVRATDFDDAVAKIAITKRLTEQQILDLFTIRKVGI
jgi:hypothetical protein